MDAEKDPRINEERKGGHSKGRALLWQKI